MDIFWFYSDKFRNNKELALVLFLCMIKKKSSSKRNLSILDKKWDTHKKKTRVIKLSSSEKEQLLFAHKSVSYNVFAKELSN